MVIVAEFLFPKWKKTNENNVAAAIMKIVKTVSVKILFFISVYKIIQKTCLYRQLFCIIGHSGEQSDLLSVFIFSYYILNSSVRT